jgi:hypothetical protein
MAKTAVLIVIPQLICLQQLVAKPRGCPNIVVIVAYDQGWNDVGFNGCREIPTPNLDALAASGVVFTSGYASHPTGVQGGRDC